MDLGAGAVFGAINTAFKFSEFAIELSEVGAENNVFVRTIQRVRLDLEETERLLKVATVKTILANNPQKRFWINSAVYSTKCALNEIGLYVERVRSDQDRDDHVSFINRVRWVLNDHGKLENRRSELAACHQTLTTILNALHPVEMLSSFNAEPPPSGLTSSDRDAEALLSIITPPPTYETTMQGTDADFLSPYNRKKRRTRMLETKLTSAKAESGHSISEDLNVITPEHSWAYAAPSGEKRRTECESETVRPVNEGEGFHDDAEHLDVVTRSLSCPDVASSILVSSQKSQQAQERRYINCSIDQQDDSDTTRVCDPTSESRHRASRFSMMSVASLPSFFPPVSLVSSPRPGSQHLTTGSPWTTSQSQPSCTCPSSSLRSERNYTSTSGPEDLHSDFLSELDSVQITAECSGPAPLQSRSPVDAEQNLAFELDASEFIGDAPARRYTAFQYPSSQSRAMGAPTVYRAYSQPSVPPVQPIMEEKEVYVTPVSEYTAYSKQPSDTRPRSSTQPQWRPGYPLTSDRQTTPMPAEPIYPRSVSPAPSFSSEVSAMEVVPSVEIGRVPMSNPALHLQALRPGYVSRPSISQSRRRKAMMEAALGVVHER